MRSLITRISKNFAKTNKNRNSHLTVFSSKQYDETYFNKVNQTLAPEKKFKFDYIETELNEKTSQLIPRDSNTVVCFVNDKLNSHTLQELKKHDIDLIALRCAGFNNVDLTQAENLGISIVRVPAYSPHAVAEHAMALILTLNRRIHKAYNRTRENNFSLDGLLGFDMYGKTVGIVGFGKIGLEFSKICNGFGMKVLVYDAFPMKPEQAAKHNVSFVSLQRVLAESDIVSLHCPLTPQTSYMINKSTLRIMKQNCIIVNTGRGALIDTKEALAALTEEKLGGLALDVYEQEEGIFFSDHSTHILQDDTLSRLHSFPNVLLTSHQAFFTHEALTNITEVTLNNILEFRETGTAQNLVKQVK